MMSTSRHFRYRARNVQRTLGVTYTTALRTVKQLDWDARSLADIYSLTLFQADVRAARKVLNA